MRKENRNPMNTVYFKKGSCDVVSPFNSVDSLNVWELVIQHYKVIHRAFPIIHHMDVSLNGGTPQTTTKWSFLVGKPMDLLGKPTI